MNKTHCGMQFANPVRLRVTVIHDLVRHGEAAYDTDLAGGNSRPTMEFWNDRRMTVESWAEMVQIATSQPFMPLMRSRLADVRSAAGAPSGRCSVSCRQDASSADLPSVLYKLSQPHELLLASIYHQRICCYTSLPSSLPSV